MLFYKHDLICAGGVYFLQRSLWYFSLQYRVGGLLRRRHEITVSRIIRKSGIDQTSCGDLGFSIGFSGIQLFCWVNEDRQAVSKGREGGGRRKDNCCRRLSEETLNYPTACCRSKVHTPIVIDFRFSMVPLSN